MKSRLAANRRLFFGAVALSAWALAGACAAEGSDLPVAERLDAAADAEPGEARDASSDAADAADADTLAPGCSEDGWCVVPFPEIDGVTLSAVWGSGPKDVWAVGSAGTIVHFDGTKWVALAKADGGTDQTLFTIWGSGPTDIWAGSTERALLHSDGWKGGQATWSFVEGSEAWKKRLADLELSEPPGKLRVWSLWGTGPNDVWMLPNDSIRAWHADGWKSGAVDWMPVLDYFPGTTVTFKGAWGPGANDVWVVGTQGKILHARGGYQGGLVDWDVVNSGTRQDLNAVWGTASDDIWTVGRVGTIRHYTYDAGDVLRWIPSNAGVDVELRAVWGTSASDVWAVGDEQTILHGDGMSWSRSRVPTSTEPMAFRGVWGSGKDDVWVVGDGVILHRGPVKVVQ